MRAPARDTIGCLALKRHLVFFLGFLSAIGGSLGIQWKNERLGSLLRCWRGRLGIRGLVSWRSSFVRSRVRLFGLRSSLGSRSCWTAFGAVSPRARVGCRGGSAGFGPRRIGASDGRHGWGSFVSDSGAGIEQWPAAAAAKIAR